jgi:dCMP deaminase
MKLKKLENYMKQAEVVALNSPDAETKVGALLVHKESGAILQASYNGFVRKVSDHLLPNTRPEKYKYIQHSEVNLIYSCARHGVSMENTEVVVTLSPCSNCLRAMYQTGVKTIYFKDKYRDFDDQITMKDLKINLSQIGRYHKIELEPK